MTRTPNYNRYRSMSKLTDNVLRENSGKTKLPCGHFASGQPLATTYGRKLYICPKGCGLQKKRS